MSYWSDEELGRFHYFELDGVKSPGTITAIAVNGAALNYDAVKGFGLSGEFLRFTGLGLATIDFTVRLVDEEDRQSNERGEWQRASAPPVQGQVDRIRTLKHPIIEQMRAVTGRWRMLVIPAPDLGTEEGGGVSFIYKFKNDRKPLPQTGKPVDPKNAAKGKVPDPFQQKVAAMTALVQAELAKGKT